MLRLRRRRVRSAVVAIAAMSLVLSAVGAVLLLDREPDQTLVGRQAAASSGWTTGVAFTAEPAGSLTGLAVYLPRAGRGSSEARLFVWSSDGKVLAGAKATLGSRSAWQSVQLTTPLPTTANGRYVVGYWADAENGRSPRAKGAPVVPPGVRILSSVTGRGDVFPERASWTRQPRAVPIWTTTIPTPSPTATSSPTATASPAPSATTKPPTTTPPSTSPGGGGNGGGGNSGGSGGSGGFPNASNTGVPKGTALGAYSGPMTITKAGTVIDAKEVRGRLVIQASDVVIKRSKLSGGVDSDTGSSSVRIEDSEVDGGTSERATIGYRNVTVLRSNIYGGKDSVNCGSNCHVEGSWLHDQNLPGGEDWHTQAYLSNGGSNVKLIDNTLQCSTRDNGAGGGCTADVSFFGDFSAIGNLEIRGNLFKATPGGYCGTFGYNAGKSFGTNVSKVSVTDNTFERGSGKCGYYGPVTGFSGGTGSTWSGNVWAGGGAISPAK